MNRKCEYKNIDKFAETKRNQQARYRKRTGAFMYERRPWTEVEDKAVLDMKMSDRELSKIICRSVGNIQKRRCRLKKQEKT